MKKKFNHLNDLDGLEVPERKTVDGKRVYVTPEGNSYPSITSILGSQPKPGLVEWRKRVGDAEANKIMKEASSLGTTVHNLCEQYLYNLPLNCDNQEAIRIFNRLRFLFGNVDNIVGLELPLYSDQLRVAGTADCFADYNLSLIHI